MLGSIAANYRAQQYAKCERQLARTERENRELQAKLQDIGAICDWYRKVTENEHAKRLIAEIDEVLSREA